ALGIAVVGAATFALLRQSLNREADRALAERAETAQASWAPLFVSGQAQQSQAPVAASAADEPDADGDEGVDVLEGGDTLLYAFGTDGQFLAESRSVSVAGLPVQDAVGAALHGTKEQRTLRVREENVRVYTAPVVLDGRIVGAIQAVRGQAE